MFDEDLPAPKKALFTPANLDGLSIDELSAYIESLKAEIERVHSNMTAKSNWQQEAEALFKK